MTGTVVACCASQPHGPWVGKFDRALVSVNRGAAANEVLVGAEVSAILGRKHLIGQHVLPGHSPVRADLGGVNVRIGALGARFTADPNVAPSVHLAAVIVLLEGLPAVLIELWSVEVAFCQRDGLAVGHQAVGRAVGAGKRRKEIIETAIGLDHNYDVRDAARPRVPMSIRVRCLKRLCRRYRYRRRVGTAAGS